MRMTNLYKETEQVLARHKLKWSHIRFVCDSTGVIPLADFTRRAAVIDYDADYGVVYIDPSLKIVGGTWWLERANYDGLEGWVFRRKPEQPGVYATPGRLLAEHPFDDKGWQDEIELYDPQEPLRWHV